MSNRKRNTRSDSHRDSHPAGHASGRPSGRPQRPSPDRPKPHADPRTGRGETPRTNAPERVEDRGGRRLGRRQARSAGRNASVWIWGSHAALAALDNPLRQIERVLATQEARARHREVLGEHPVEDASPASIAALLPAGAVHQGLAILVTPLELQEISEVCQPSTESRSIVLVLDQVTDPRNVGAILRSAAAFGVQAVVSTEAHAPPESGTLAKAASGALERVPYVRVSNLARALDDLAKLGYWRVGLDSEAKDVLKAEKHTGAVVVVLGAEGTGMRRLTAEHCDFRARLSTNPVPGATGSLNVSVAASVALYELSRS